MMKAGVKMEEKITDMFEKDSVDMLNHQLDVAILECLEKNHLVAKECELLSPRTPFDGKYYLIPKKYAPKVGEMIDFSKAFVVCEFKMKERKNKENGGIID